LDDYPRSEERFAGHPRTLAQARLNQPDEQHDADHDDRDQAEQRVEISVLIQLPRALGTRLKTTRQIAGLIFPLAHADSIADRCSSE
jgi:hypothetical protein